MSTKTRIQFSLRFDNYSELLDQVKFYCQQNGVSLTEFTAHALQEKLERTTSNCKIKDIGTQIVEFKEELANTCKRLENVEQFINEFITYQNNK